MATEGLKKIILIGIAVYRKIFSPFIFSIIPGGCRFKPTCSLYAETAIYRFGLKKGIKLSMMRILRCHPGASSYYDPVPVKV